jgi:MoaA/NifB/PqqE/SkfB family radical SAM enzyme
MKHQDINTLQFEITSYCNSFCPHCPRFDENGELHPDLSLEHWDMAKIISYLDLGRMINLKNVIIEGDKGDPLMHPKILSLLDNLLSHPNFPTVQLTTNGCIRDTKWWSELGSSRNTKLEVTFSIDGLEDTYHLYRKGLDYHKTISNAKAFIDAGGHAIWKFLTFKHNQHQIAQSRELSKKLGFASFSWAPSHVDRFQGRQSWTVRDANQSYEIYPTTDTSSGNTKMPKKSVPVKEVPQRLCPNLSRGHIYVNYQGMVIPCCMMHFDTKLEYFGKDRLQELTGGFEKQNLNLRTLEEILQDEFFSKNLMHSLKSGKWHFNCARSCKAQIKENLKISHDHSN